MLSMIFVLLLANLVLIWATQYPLLDPTLSKDYASTSASHDTHPPITFAIPEKTLASIITDEYTHFSHPEFLGYGGRVKRAKGFCDPMATAYTGYIDINYGRKHLFFFFFESRSNPEQDDLLMWINGGPGGSSAMGLFMELGPCLLDTTGKSKNGTVFNPYSWNDKANVFFLDQPVGVGFSYAESGEVVGTTEDAAKDIAAFMYLFCETFSEFKGRPFHMAGESYAGRYIPVFASEIVDQNKHAIARGYTPIKLASVMIGNGLTDRSKMMKSYYEMACTNVSVSPVLDISTCVRMKQAVPRCEKMIHNACVTAFDALGCTAADLFCDTELVSPVLYSGVNPYDLSSECDGTYEETLCYTVYGKIGDYLNLPEVRSLIGIDAKFGNYSPISMAINVAFAHHMDEWHPNEYYVAGLLERGVDVLIYAGSTDWMCNWVGNSRWVAALEWGGQSEYNAKEFDDWVVDGHAGGITKSARGLTFATVQGAGHMVPYDKPVESLVMVNRWIASRKL